MNKVTAFLTILVATVVLTSDYAKHLWRELKGYERFLWGMIVTLALFAASPLPSPRSFGSGATGRWVQVLFNPEQTKRVFTDVHDRSSHWYGAIQVYAPVLLLGMLPWSLVLWPRLRGLWRQRRALPAWWRARAIEDRWLLLWFCLPLAVFCLARSRLPLYLLPLMVPLALLIARRWQPALPAQARRIVLTAACSALALLALKGGVPLLPHAKDTRQLAAAMRQHWPNPGEIVSIEESALYGLRFYLDVP